MAALDSTKQSGSCKNQDFQQPEPVIDLVSEKIFPTSNPLQELPRAQDQCAESPAEALPVPVDEAAWLFQPGDQKWPASRLSFYDMMRLRMLSNKLAKPVNQVIQLAVEEFAGKHLGDQECKRAIARYMKPMR